jgi:hypothetical protein
MIGNGKFSPVKSIIPGSNVTSNITVELIKKGFMYTVQTVITGLTVDSVKNFYLDPSAFTGDFLVIYELSYAVSQGKGVGEIFVTGDYEQGTLLSAFNRNENSSNTPQSKISVDPTINDLGVGTFKYLAGSEAQGNNLGGGGFKGNPDFPLEVNKTLDRIFRVTQSGGSGTYDLELRLVFAEITV